MRKWLWFGCLAGAVSAASLSGSWYAYKNPDSLPGRCAAVGLQVGTRFNPLLNGSAIAVVDLTKLTWNGEETVAEGCERPGEPSAVEEPADTAMLIELPGLLQLPLPRMPGAIRDDADDLILLPSANSTVEPPLADGSVCEMPRLQIVDPAVHQVVGTKVALPALTRPYMPPCKEDEPAVKKSCHHGALYGACWKSVAHCWIEAAKVCDASWVGFWCGYFTSSPTLLEMKSGDEPKKVCEPGDCKEDPNRSHQHSGSPTPSTVVPPDSVPTAESLPWPLPLVEPKQMNDTKGTEPVTHPEVDTMEFRSSDRTWDEMGPPFVL